jgi:hypothetical protein
MGGKIMGGQNDSVLHNLALIELDRAVPIDSTLRLHTHRHFF